jgi:Na+-driven multidrug efflux pump
MVLIGAMQGAGDTVRPFWITFITMWLIRVPLAAVLALKSVPLGFVSVPGLGMGADGCWLTLAITQAIQGAVCIWVWRQGRWQLAKV